MREQIELLEHHADLAPDRVDALQVVGQFDAVDDNSAALMLLEAIDAADQRRLARARGAANDDPLAARHEEVDVAQDVKLAVPFVDADHLDGGAGRLRLPRQAHRPRPLPSRRSI